MALRMLAAVILLSAGVSAVVVNEQGAPCFWQNTYALRGRSYVDFLCSDVQSGSTLSYEASSVSGFDEFGVLVFSDKDYALWNGGNPERDESAAPAGPEAKCINVGCDRMDAYSKSGSTALSSAYGPYHVVLYHYADDRKTAEFEVTVSVSAFANDAIIPGGQLTGAPPPPPANVCEAIQDALPDFCTLAPGCSTIDCQVPLYFDTFDVELTMNFCAEPINISISVGDSDNEFSWNDTVSIGDWLIPIPGATVDIPFIGNATLNVVIFLDGSRSGLNISVGLEACLDSGLCFPNPPIAIITGVFDFTGLPCPPSDILAPSFATLRPAPREKLPAGAAALRVPRLRKSSKFMAA